MEEDWGNETRKGTGYPSKIETQVWESKNSQDSSRSKGRGLWNQSEDVENWRKPGDDPNRGRRSEDSNGQWNNSDRQSYKNEGRGKGVDRGGRSERGGFGGGNRDDTADSSVMTVPSSKVGKIIGKGGSKIRELSEDSGARIDVKRDSDNNGETTVEISGSADATNRARELINELISDSGDSRGSRSYGGNYESSAQFGGGNRYGGSNENTADGSVMMVPSSKVGRIIGKGGSKIRELQEDSGARIDVKRDSDYNGETTVEISGSADAVYRAKELINELISDSGDSRGSRSYGGSNGYNEPSSQFGGGNRYGGSYRDESDGSVMTVPSSVVGRIIGKGGSKIRELREDSGARIDVKRDNDGCGETTIEISGSPDEQNRARDLINDLVSDSGDRGSRPFGGNSGRYGDSEPTFGGRNDSSRGQSYGDSSAMTVPSSSVGMIIGKGGSKIRELQEESGAGIKVQRDSDNYGETTVDISGSAGAISKAKELINELISDSEDRGSRSFGGGSGGSRSFGDSLTFK